MKALRKASDDPADHALIGGFGPKAMGATTRRARRREAESLTMLVSNFENDTESQVTSLRRTDQDYEVGTG